jgi:hypothetical protein
MGLDPDQFRRLVRETLTLGGLYSGKVEEFLFAIAAHESHLGTYLWQIGGGPARGLFGMEINTMLDIWQHYLGYPSRANQRGMVRIVTGISGPSAWALTVNQAYQILMARFDLLRDPDPIPEIGDSDGYAAYWKKNWNSHLGAGTIEKFKTDYARFKEKA